MKAEVVLEPRTNNWKVRFKDIDLAGHEFYFWDNADSFAARFNHALAAHDQERIAGGVELAEKISELFGRTKQENARLKTELEKTQAELARVLDKHRILRRDMLRILVVSNYPTVENAIALIKQARRAEWAQAGMLCSHCNDFTGVPPSFIDQCMHCGKCK